MAEVFVPDASDEPRTNGNPTKTRSKRQPDNPSIEFLLLQLWTYAPASWPELKEDAMV